MRGVLVLAGGQGERLGGQEKALIEIGGQPIIHRVINVAENVASEIVVSCRDKKQKQVLDDVVSVPLVVDERVGVGPLMGIYSGFKRMGSDYVAVVACDMPHLNTDVLGLLFGRARGHDVAIPVWPDDRLEPLCAVYHRENFIENAERILEKDGRRIIAGFDELDVVRVPVDVFPKEVFFNVNTPEDIQRLEG